MKQNFIKYMISIIVALLAIVWLFPLGVVILNALKTPNFYIMNPFWAFPDQLGFLDNLHRAWYRGGLGAGFINSFIYGILGSTLAISLAALAAYSLTTLKIKGRFFWFIFIYSGTIFPFQMYLIPLFDLYSSTGMYDTRVGLIVFYVGACIPFCLFVLRNYFTTIGKEIVEAAKIDGSSDLRIFAQMFVPMSLAPITVLYLFQFTFIWNDLLFGLTLSKSTGVKPIMAGLASLQGIYSGSNMPTTLTAVLIASIPTLLLFALLQKYFMQGLVIAKVK